MLVACFLQIAFFQILWHYCCFNLLQNKIWVCFCVNIHILSLFFRFASLFLHLVYLLVLFFDFTYETQVRLAFSVKLPILGLFLKLGCFYKITWYHWTGGTAVGYAVGWITIPCISNCWARPWGLQKIACFNWGSMCRKVWEPLI